MEFASADDAALAISAMNGHKFDAKHTFLLNRFTDVEKFQDYDETFVEPEVEEFKPRVCFFSSKCFLHQVSLTSYRNTFELGLRILKAATNMSRTEELKLRFTGTEGPRNLTSTSRETCVDWYFSLFSPVADVLS